MYYIYCVAKSENLAFILFITSFFIHFPKCFLFLQRMNKLKAIWSVYITGFIEKYVRKRVFVRFGYYFYHVDRLLEGLFNAEEHPILISKYLKSYLEITRRNERQNRTVRILKPKIKKQNLKKLFSPYHPPTSKVSLLASQ